MHRFRRSPEKWWQKPLVEFRGRPLPAELAVLALESKTGERGVWMNSRGIKSGVSDLVAAAGGSKTSYRTVRTALPSFVSSTVERIYANAGLKRGCPDLVLWLPESGAVRFIEVKCFNRDSPTTDQERFIEVGKSLGATGEIVEWEFVD